MRLIVFATVVFVSSASGAGLVADDNLPTFAPQQESLPVPPPAGAMVLLDATGKHLFLSMAGEATDWPSDNGELVSTKKGNNANHVVSKFHFRDAELHVEFAVHEKSGGNSGVYILGHYEMQIFNSFGKENPSDQDEGALYGFAKPLVNAARKAGEWQVYDIRFRAPRRDESGKITEEGCLSAWLNGQLVQDQTRFGEPRSVYHPYRHGVTPYLEAIATRQKKTMTGPVFLQDHGSPTKFRNIWIRPLDSHARLYEPEPQSELPASNEK